MQARQSRNAEVYCCGCRFRTSLQLIFYEQPVSMANRFSMEQLDLKMLSKTTHTTDAARAAGAADRRVQQQAPKLVCWARQCRRLHDAVRRESLRFGRSEVRRERDRQPRCHCAARV